MNVKLNDLKEIVKSFAENIKKENKGLEDFIFVYFCCHGVEVNGEFDELCLLTSDNENYVKKNIKVNIDYFIDENKINKNKKKILVDDGVVEWAINGMKKDFINQCFTLRELIKCFKDVKGKVFVFLDCCRKPLRIKLGVETLGDNSKSYFKDLNDNTSMLIAFSTSRGEEAVGVIRDCSKMDKDYRNGLSLYTSVLYNTLKSNDGKRLDKIIPEGSICSDHFIQNPEIKRFNFNAARKPIYWPYGKNIDDYLYEFAKFFIADKIKLISPTKKKNIKGYKVLKWTVESNVTVDDLKYLFKYFFNQKIVDEVRTLHLELIDDGVKAGFDRKFFKKYFGNIFQHHVQFTISIVHSAIFYFFISSESIKKVDNLLKNEFKKKEIKNLHKKDKCSMVKISVEDCCKEVIEHKDCILFLPNSCNFGRNDSLIYIPDVQNFTFTIPRRIKFEPKSKPKKESEKNKNLILDLESKEKNSDGKIVYLSPYSTVIPLI